MIKLYLAGAERAYLPQLTQDSNLLLSFASSSQMRFLPELEGRDLIIDSGAYSVFHQGQAIDLAAYCAFVQTHPWLTACIALDVIGGTAVEQLANLDIMEAAALPVPVWPVYHYGDDIALLQEYVRRGYRKIALSAAQKIRSTAAADWLWSVLDCYPPSPDRVYHGLGLTHREILSTMGGWLESVDSTGWLGLAMYGAKRNQHLFNGLSRECYRELGRLIYEDIARHGTKQERPQVLPLFDLEEASA